MRAFKTLVMGAIVLASLSFFAAAAEEEELFFPELGGTESFITKLMDESRPVDPSDAVSLAHRPNFEVPRVVESGSLVSINLWVEHPMEPKHYIEALTLIDEGSLVKLKVVAFLTPLMARPYISLTVRLGKTTQLKAFVKCNLHGSFWGYSPKIKVGQGGCGTAGLKFTGRLLPNIFRSNFSRSSDDKKAVRVNLSLRHPMDPGLAISKNGKVEQKQPPFFLKDLKVFSEGQLVCQFSLGPGMSNNPLLVFPIKAEGRESLLFKGVNNQGQTFESLISLKSRLREYF